MAILSKDKVFGKKKPAKKGRVFSEDFESENIEELFEDSVELF